MNRSGWSISGRCWRTRDTRLARHAMRKRCALPPGSGWVNYVRGHDDIGWGFADEDAAAFHIDGFGHRQFLNAFYTGRFPRQFRRRAAVPGKTRAPATAGSPAPPPACAGWSGRGFPATPRRWSLAVRRVVLLHGLVLTMPGLPLIWLGDEVGRENDLSYRDDPTLAVDARWVHRPVADWPAEDAARADPDSPGGRIFRGIRRLAAVRRAEPALGGEAVEILPLANPHVFGMERVNAGRRAVVLANVTERGCNGSPTAASSRCWGGRRGGTWSRRPPVRAAASACCWSPMRSLCWKACRPGHDGDF